MTDREAAAVQAIRDHALWFTEDGLASCAACDWTSPDDLAWEAHVVAATWPHIAAAIADAIEAKQYLTPNVTESAYNRGVRVSARIARSTKPTGETP